MISRDHLIGAKMKKKKIKSSADDFVKNTSEIIDFTVCSVAATSLTGQHKSWCFDLAIIRLYREFEYLMQSCLIALINNDSETFSKVKNRKFPLHMSVSVCEYFVCGDGYFDFKGRDGLISTIRKFVPKEHWFLKIVRSSKYNEDLDKLIALRNFAAHGSAVSRKNALNAIKQTRLLSSGAWLKNKGRFNSICKNLQRMAKEIETKAPH